MTLSPVTKFSSLSGSIWKGWKNSHPPHKERERWIDRYQMMDATLLLIHAYEPHAYEPAPVQRPNYTQSPLLSLSLSDWDLYRNATSAVQIYLSSRITIDYVTSEELAWSEICLHSCQPLSSELTIQHQQIWDRVSDELLWSVICVAYPESLVAVNLS